MPAPTIIFNWSKQGQYDWRTPEGIAQLQEQLCQKLLWEPNIDLQLKPLAELLMGKHGLVISATSDGKSAIFYMYSLMRPDTMTIVIAPTNALEDDMVRTLSNLNISAVALNSEALDSVTLANTNIIQWLGETCGRKPVRDTTALFSCPQRCYKQSNSWSLLRMQKSANIRLLDKWGVDFWKAYGEIRRTIPWLPPWTARLALTATLEPN
ncbi:hypothetical protein BC835DRAFT_1309603 [Cytidiella melzeri]|nr:hypothetical protein BC835DRAFT_1309603 [Cytidiella melzeri]